MTFNKKYIIYDTKNNNIILRTDNLNKAYHLYEDEEPFEIYQRVSPQLPEEAYK